MAIGGSRKALVWLLLGVWALAGCGENPVFGRIEKKVDVVANVDDQQLRGQERLVFRVTVSANLIHPEFHLRWTNLNTESNVDVYVLPDSSYYPDVPPQDLEHVLWTSVPPDGANFGDRSSSIQVHPAPGEWVLFFFNPADAGVRALYADLTAEIQLTYFQ